MNNGTLKGDDTITKENLEQVKDYLNNNFPSMDVACEINDGQLFLEFSGQKFVLDPNTKVNELIYSFNQYVGNDASNAPIIVDNDTYYRRNKRKRTVANVKNYRIDIDPDLYNSYSESLNNIASNISTTAASFDDSMFSDKLATFYSGLGVDNTKDMEGAKSMIEDLSMKIKYSVQLYENTDDELQYFFNSMVNQVFAYDDFKNGGSVEYLSFEDREKNIQNYIDSMKDLYNSMYDQYIKLYGTGIPLETEKVNQMLHLFDALGAFSTQDGFTDLNLFSYEDYEGKALKNPGYQTFADTQYFNADYFKLFMDKCEDKNCIQALKNYIDGKDWYSSGMDDSFGENLRTMWSNYSDGNPTETDAELIFLNRYFGKQKNNKFYDDYHLHGENSNPEIAYSYLDFQTFVGKRQNVEDEIDYIEDVLANWGKEGYTEKDLDYYFIPKDLPSGMNPYSKEGTQYILNYLKTAPTDEILNYTQETTTYFDHLRNGLTEKRNVTEEKWLVGGIEYTKESFRNNSIMGEFFGKRNENNVFYYDEIDDREGLTRYFKSYIKDQKILETYDYISNETTNCLSLRQQMMSVGSQVYNLEQYQKLMPFEDVKKDPEYLKFLGETYETDSKTEWLDQTELAVYNYLKSKNRTSECDKYLVALEDTINQRKGLTAAAKFVEMLNSGHKEADILRELSPILGDVKEFFVVASNTTTVGLDGFAQGIFNFGKGFYNLVNADGVRDASDYAMAFKAQLLSSANEYNENIPDYAREIYFHTSQVMSSVGNMFIPMMLSAVPTIGPVLSKTTLFLSSFGNNLESSLQEGYTGPQAYLYSALSSSLELATESILGSIPGIGGNAPTNLASQKGWNFLKTLGMSMYDEGKEEFIQSYAEAGLRYLILGEPIDLSQTTGEAFQAFIYGALSSGIMNMGQVIPFRLKNGDVVNMNQSSIEAIVKEHGNDTKILDITDDGDLIIQHNDEQFVVRQEEVSKKGFLDKLFNHDKSVYDQNLEYATNKYGKNSFGLLNFCLRNNALDSKIDSLLDSTHLKQDIKLIQDNPQQYLTDNILSPLYEMYNSITSYDAAGNVVYDLSSLKTENFEKLAAMANYLVRDSNFRTSNYNTMTEIGRYINNIGKAIIESDNSVDYVTKDNITIKVYGKNGRVIDGSVGTLIKALDQLSPEIKQQYVGKEIKLYDQQDYDNISSLMRYYCEDANSTTFVSAGGFNRSNNNFTIYNTLYSDISLESLINTLNHEGGHSLDCALGELFGQNGAYLTSISSLWSDTVDVENQNGYGSVSDYGDTKIYEDWAESIAKYQQDKDGFKAAHPERARVIELLSEVYDPTKLSIQDKIDLTYEMSKNGIYQEGQAARILGTISPEELSMLPRDIKLKIINQIGLNTRGDVSTALVNQFIGSTGDLDFVDRIYLYNTFDNWDAANEVFTKLVFDSGGIDSSFCEMLNSKLNDYQCLIQNADGTTTVDQEKLGNRRKVMGVINAINSNSPMSVVYNANAISDPSLRSFVQRGIIKNIISPGLD